MLDTVMIAPDANDGKGLGAITDLLMKSYSCPNSDRGLPSWPV
jgi:hypothetical protein